MAATQMNFFTLYHELKDFGKKEMIPEDFAEILAREIISLIVIVMR